MKVTKKRMHNLDPRWRNEVKYVYYARRHDGFTRANEYGHSRAFIVGRGYGATPKQATLNARKSRSRRPAKRVVTARRLADDRRYSEYVRDKFEAQFRPMRLSAQAWLQLECEHEWRDCHPRARRARACVKCETTTGVNPNAPDSLRDYF